MGHRTGSQTGAELPGSEPRSASALPDTRIVPVLAMFCKDSFLGFVVMAIWLLVIGEAY